MDTTLYRPGAATVTNTAACSTCEKGQRREYISALVEVKKKELNNSHLNQLVLLTQLLSPTFSTMPAHRTNNCSMHCKNCPQFPNSRGSDVWRYKVDKHRAWKRCPTNPMTHFNESPLPLPSRPFVEFANARNAYSDR